MNCPECTKEILDMPKREPLPTSATSATTYTNAVVTYFGSTDYSPTAKDYKCSNPKCWVTRVNISWS